MKMRTKLVFAQLPLVAALAVTMIVAIYVTRGLADRSRDILKDNYRSVLAAQNIKEAAERINGGVLFAIAGRAGNGRAQIETNVAKLEHEVGVQEANITEPGEREATAKLRAAWNAYAHDIAALGDAPAEPDLRERYFARLSPEFLAVKDAADAILALNQDAMIRKSDTAQQLASESNQLLVSIPVIGLVLALVAASVMTTRVLRPLSVVSQTARRIGEGDLAVRAKVAGKDEIADLARELNTMADHLQRYRKSSLGELLEAQLAAQATIDSLPDAVLVVALDGELRHANQAAEALLKVRPEAGSHALATVDPAVRPVIDRLRQSIAAGHGPYVPKGLEEAIKLTTADGERALLPRATPLYAEEGDVVAATIVLQDVTRLRRFEELRNDLVATVAHEFRTPLTSLRMAVHLLSEETVGPLTRKQADLVFAAREDCDRLQSIVDELLDLSRIQADRIELRTAEIDPELLIGAALDAHAGEAEARHVKLVTELLPGMPAIVADRERIQLVLDNLLSNAIKYGLEGGTVTVRAVQREGVLRIEVSDQGPGIRAEDQPAIFEKFVRVPDAPAGGAGIGLYIAREIVRAHGGSIGVDSEPGQGATFWFTVKLAQDELLAGDTGA
ncbi:MAG TPA: ATP-binding protein [Kofleriaceae bacterium]|jgi:signal transduction histidine kinase|nr:ATP-binding protein [Kofleriaceae bacterium]